MACLGDQRNYRRACGRAGMCFGGSTDVHTIIRQQGRNRLLQQRREGRIRLRLSVRVRVGGRGQGNQGHCKEQDRLTEARAKL
jgi:hypothetical protein